eukprot:2827252-Pyramimonas_sp.AAC.1
MGMEPHAGAATGAFGGAPYGEGCPKLVSMMVTITAMMMATMVIMSMMTMMITTMMMTTMMMT